MNDKLNIVLDLDNTLISSLEYNDLQSSTKYKKRLTYFTHHYMDEVFVICERPGLQQFLDYVFKHFNVSVWTAATKNYALYIIEKIIISNHKDRKLDWVFYSEHCEFSKSKTGHSKDLSILKKHFKIDNFTKTNTFILDDYDEVYNTQPKNCIIVREFNFTTKDSEDDVFLLSIIPYLNRIVKNKNIKSIDSINFV